MSRQSELAELSRVYDNSALSNRNLIINGAMQVNQRGDSTGVTAEGYYGPDRFQFSESGRDQFQVSISQASDGPDGYSNSYKVQATTAESAIDASEYVLVRQVVEAQNLQHLKYGTSSAQQLTASFWVKSSIAATFGVFMYQYDGNRIIGSTYTINSANTWEYKTVTFAGDTGGTINDDNGNGQYLAFTLAAGSDMRTTDNTSWSAYASGKLGYGHTTAANAVMTTTNATWQVTGVQLEVGDSATPFENRSFGDELLRCQRYYFQEDTTTSNASGRLGVANSATSVTFNHTLPVQMRANPSLALTSASLRIGDTVAAGFTTTSGTVTISSYSGSAGAVYNLNQFSGLTSYRSYLHEPDSTSTGIVVFNAEL
tara:strand:+ start:252 stop:1364 length:1113 start_codon:yes stop_codon:yes gene_type:complete